MASLTVCTWNVGDKGSKDNLRALMDRYPVLCLQECGDRDNFYDCAWDYGWKCFDGDGKDGKHATPVFWNPEVMGEKVDTYVKMLSPETYAPGTGPDTVKCKWLIGVGWNFPKYDKQLRIGCLHLVSDSGSGKRRDLAHDQLVVASKMWPDAEGFCCIAGDYNTSWNNDLLDPMRNKHWKPAQGGPGGPVKTHDGWTPDQQWYRNGKVSSQGERTNASDHDAYWVTYTL